MTKICANPKCGHEIKVHRIDSGDKRGDGCYHKNTANSLDCPCKKFEAEVFKEKYKYHGGKPQNHSPESTVSKESQRFTGTRPIASGTFNLSEKINHSARVGHYWDTILAKDIKEFIRRRIEDLHSVNRGDMDLAMALARLKKDSGKELSG